MLRSVVSNRLTTAACPALLHSTRVLLAPKGPTSGGKSRVGDGVIGGAHELQQAVQHRRELRSAEKKARGDKKKSAPIGGLGRPLPKKRSVQPLALDPAQADASVQPEGARRRRKVIGEGAASLEDVLTQPGGLSSSSEVTRAAIGGNSQLIIDDSEGNLGSAKLVYSPLNNRIMHRDNPFVTSLLTMGFDINEHSKEVYLKSPEEFNAFAHAVRNSGHELPRCWKTRMIAEVGSLIQNPRVEDPASHVQRMIDAKKASRRQTIGFIGTLDPAGASAAERAAREESESRNIVLNKEQREVLEWAIKGHSLYVGGCAGTGKTVLLTALKRRLTSHGLRVAMTATTGIAGCHIGGATFHHTFSVAQTDEFTSKKNLLSYDVVVIDEVSMMSRRLFEDFDAALRHEAGIDVPFGGVQVIVCGDFLQLSPVNEESILDSPLFQKYFVLTCLKQQVRQSAHPLFAEMLSTMRIGVCPPDIREFVRELPPGTMAPDAVNLLPTNVQVREANQKELDRLEGPIFKTTPRVSEVKLEGEFTPTIVLQVDSSFNGARLLRQMYDFICEKVMLRSINGFSLYRLFNDGYALRIALPQAESTLWKRALVTRFLEAAVSLDKWAVGASVQNIVKDAEGLHTREMEDELARQLKNHPVVQPQELKEGCRVLLRSNLTTNLVNGSVGVVKGFCPCESEYVHSYLRSDPEAENVIKEYAQFHEIELGYPAVLPMVQFSEGMPPIAIPPVNFKVGGTASTQFYALEGIAVPLTLAYAFTVHKVQGLTLCGRVHLELSQMWPCDHLLYVAMSRVKDPSQLSMSGFDPKMVVASPRAVEFDRALQERDEVFVPEQASVAMWKGFDTYSATQDFYKRLESAGTAAATQSTPVNIARLAAERAASPTAALAKQEGASAAIQPKPVPVVIDDSVFARAAARGIGKDQYFLEGMQTKRNATPAPPVVPSGISFLPSDD